jgi:adenylate cyclase
MGPLFGWLRAHRLGMSVGTTATVAVALAFHFGQLAPVSMWLLDLKFTQFNRVEADDRVVMIDITDYALERIHRWPWPREYHAGLIRSLTELGAAAILMDIVFDSSEKGYYDDPRLAADVRIDPPTDVVGSVDSSNVVFGDDLLTNDLREAGDVYLAMFARLYDPQYDPERVRETAYSIFANDALISIGDFERRMAAALGGSVDWFPREEGRSSGRTDRSAMFQRLKIEFCLERDFSLDEDRLAMMLGVAPRVVVRHIAPAKRTVARRLMMDCLRSLPRGEVENDRDHPDRLFRKVLDRVLPGSRFDEQTADRQDVKRALESSLSVMALLDSAIPVDPSLVGRIRNASDVTLPYYPFTGASNVGLVVFETDSADGVMRRVPLVVNLDGKLVKHLGFALVCELLDIDPYSISLVDDVYLTMLSRSGDHRWRIEMDRQGRSLISWHVDRDHPESWQRSFDHIPVARVMTIFQNMEIIDRLRGRYAYRVATYVEAVSSQGDMGGETVSAAFAEYESKVRRVKQLRWSGDESDAAMLGAMEGELERIEAQSVATIGEWGEGIETALRGGQVRPEELSPFERTIRRLSNEIDDLRALKEETSRRVVERVGMIDARRQELRLRVSGKVCLVGYTASAVADTVNTPVFDEVPGVMAHANVINSMLVGLFPNSISVRYPWFDVFLILAVGLPTSVITTWRDPWFSLVTMLLTLWWLMVVSLSVFYTSSLHVDVVGPLLACFLAWAFVTMYRQLIEERHKRAISRSLAQYTSPAIAKKLTDQLTQRSGELDLSPRSRVVTCFFSDLKGFTSISERLGASRTRDVLNPYLEAMSEELIRTSAMINKFMGDGIFAFYNPPVLPVEDHARSACEAALESFVALERLKDELAHGDLAEEVRGLSMRIGINTGEVFVGDYGSRNKLDYTCIGDTVNLSARLEPACKPFGIEAMISESTLREAGEGFVVRHLGGLQVVGKTEAVQVYELVGRKGETSEDVLAYANLFGEAVALFQERDWEASRRVLLECGRLRPDDRAVGLMTLNIEGYESDPPGEDWNRAIELTSK